MPRRIAEERRAGILAAVAETLQAEGLPFPSYDRVAGHAALSRQLVRHYFPDPEGLMVSACQKVTASYLAEIARHLEAVDDEEGLTRLIDLCLDGAGARDEVPPPPAFESLIALARSSPAVRDALKAEVRALRSLFSREVGRAHPQLAPEEREEVAHLLVAQLLGHWTMSDALALRPGDPGSARAAMQGIVSAYTAQA